MAVPDISGLLYSLNIFIEIVISSAGPRGLVLHSDKFQ